MKLVVTGKTGQVASCLHGIRATDFNLDGFEVVLAGRPEFDLTKPDDLRRIIKREKPDVLVSAAAYTAVDRAEGQQDLAFSINAFGAGSIAKIAAEFGIPIIHLSTDYVFSGEKEGLYVESDATHPKSVYGKSKLLGEELVAQNNAQHVILRTAWVYSPFGNNFVKTMLRLALDHDEVSVVGDQYGNPTSAHAIARAIVLITHQLKANPGRSLNYGLFHLSGYGATNWSGFASHIFACSKSSGGPHASVSVITTEDYQTTAMRPKNSRLDCQKLNSVYGIAMPDWKTSSADIVTELLMLKK